MRLNRPGALVAIVLCGLALDDCSGPSLSFLDPQGPVAAAQREHFFEVLALLAIVVLPVLVLTPLVAWRYRYGRAPDAATPYEADWEFSRGIEIAIWAVPVAIVAVLAVLLWNSVHALDPYRPIVSAQPPLRVQVIGYDWKWLFVYPDLGLATVGEMAFPDDRPVALDITSATVMQSFLIPALGSQIYAMGGMRTQLHLAADGPGTYLGENTAYSGMGFQHQKFTARSLPPAEFDAWVARTRKAARPFDARALAAIEAKGTSNELHDQIAGGKPIVSYTDPPSRAVDARLTSFSGVPVSFFDDVVMATMDGTKQVGIARITPSGRPAKYDRPDQPATQLMGSMPEMRR